MKNWILEDDGSLDTVARCKTCGKVTRFDSLALLPEEDEQGRPIDDLRAVFTDDEIEASRLENLDAEDCMECENPND